MPRPTNSELDLYGLETTFLPHGVMIMTARLEVNHGTVGKPLWFETMIYGGKLRGRQWRYTTADEARKGHEAAVAAAQAEDRPTP